MSCERSQISLGCHDFVICISLFPLLTRTYIYTCAHGLAFCLPDFNSFLVLFVLVNTARPPLRFSTFLQSVFQDILLNLDSHCACKHNQTSCTCHETKSCKNQIEFHQVINEIFVLVQKGKLIVRCTKVSIGNRKCYGNCNLYYSYCILFKA